MSHHVRDTPPPTHSWAAELFPDLSSYKYFWCVFLHNAGSKQMHVLHFNRCSQVALKKIKVQLRHTRTCHGWPCRVPPVRMWVTLFLQVGVTCSDNTPPAPRGAVTFQGCDCARSPRELSCGILYEILPCSEECWEPWREENCFLVLGPCITF